jgi:hypothetical protein
MGGAVAFLIWLTCIGIAAIMVGLFIQNLEKEGFADPASSKNIKSNINITSCPRGSTSFVTNEGNTNCCEGDIVNNMCNGNIICSLSPSINGGIQSCPEWITSEWLKRSNKFCLANMPYYFGTLERSPNSEGCSASLSNADGSAPEDLTLAKCKIYGNMTDELANTDSCFNATALNRMVCPQTDSKKIMTSFGKPTPVIFTCSYIPKDGSTNGIPTSCYDAQRAIEYINNLSWLPTDQKNSIITMINSKKDSRFCNYDKAAIGTGFMMSGPGISGTIPVQRILGKVGAPRTAYIAQNGNTIIVLEINPNNKKAMGFTAPGKLSDYDISTDDKFIKIFDQIFPDKAKKGFGPTNDYALLETSS